MRASDGMRDSYGRSADGVGSEIRCGARMHCVMTGNASRRDIARDTKEG